MLQIRQRVRLRAGSDCSKGRSRPASLLGRPVLTIKHDAVTSCMYMHSRLAAATISSSADAHAKQMYAGDSCHMDSMQVRFWPVVCCLFSDAYAYAALSSWNLI